MIDAALPRFPQSRRALGRVRGFERPWGTALYAGTWTSRAYDGNTELTLNLHCESVDRTAMRADLQAVCGAKGFDATVSASCTRPDGATTLNCRFDAGDIVFTRQ